MIRAHLTQDWSDEWGQTWKTGQTGSYERIRDGLVIFTFDGYEEKKAADAQRRREFGEGFNVVSWIAELPVTVLKADERSAVLTQIGGK